MLVNWIRDVEAAVAQGKAETKSLLIDFSAPPPEAHALGWKLSLTQIRKLPISFTRILSRWKHI